jgi:hypothetical protein
MKDDVDTPRTELRRRTRRVGLLYAASSPVVCIVFGVVARPTVGVLLGAIWLALGLYVGFAYAPFAEWLRRREQSR